MPKLWMRTIRTITDDFGGSVTVRRCNRCSSWLELVYENFMPRGRKDGEVVEWDCACRPCRRASNRQYYATSPGEPAKVRARRRHRRKTNLESARRESERNRAASRRRRQLHPEKVRDEWQVYYAKLKKDPVRWEGYKTRMRMNYQLRQERKGERVKPQVKVSRRDVDRLSVVPLLAFLDPRVKSFEPSSTLGLKLSRAEREASWAAEIGVPWKTYYEWRVGKRKEAQFNTVDRLLITHNVNWFDVYERPANGHASGRPQDVLRYVAEAEVYIQASLAFTGELVE